jgi:4-carboxymuconolactone decarboxylase
MDREMDARQTGRKIMNELIGEGYVEAKDKRKNFFTGVLDEYSEEVCFGRIWARDGIDRKTRSILNIGMLVALNRPVQLRSHIEGALNNGCTVEELRELLLQTAMYCGLPAASEAFKVGQDVLEKRGLLK